jgi:ABC-type glutathione transport system ATPase component
LPDPPHDFTPVTLITRFLGSGKTTLLQRLLDPALSDTAVLLNEFGDIGLDHHLLGRIDEKMVMLQSGCVCCTIRGELSSAIRICIRAPKAVCCRPSGAWLSKARALPTRSRSCRRSDPVLRHHFCLGNVITTVDAVNGARQLDVQPESMKQVSVAERARLILAGAFARPSNLLVLDEPTNDLDLETLDLLQEKLTAYAVTVLLVSHHRDFLDRVVTSVIASEGVAAGSSTPARRLHRHAGATRSRATRKGSRRETIPAGVAKAAGHQPAFHAE